MVVVSALYPNEPGSSFDYDYFLHKHVPLCKGTLAIYGPGRPASDARRPVRWMAALHPIRSVALLTFRSLEDFQNAVQAHGQEILDDIPNFTSVQPLVQINEDLT